MEFVHDSSYGTLKRYINIIDGPVMPHPSSATGKKIRIGRFTAEYILRSGEWVVTGSSRISMSGVVLKKDGTEGKETWGGPVHYGWESMKEYRWARKLIDAMRPEGSPVLPFRLSGLENDDQEDEA